MPVELRSGTWEALGADALAVRTAVFVREQGIPIELEHDENDARSLHCVAYLDRRPIGAGRLLPDGHVGRMAVLADARRAGVGRRILEELISLARARGDSCVELNAQCHVEPFYRAHGFEPLGQPFHEAGIAHVRMRRTLASS